jgi:hypothetical protein
VSNAAADLAETEAERYVPESKRDLDRAIAAFVGGRAVDAWRLRTNALDLAGYRPGDILVVDRDLDARPATSSSLRRRGRASVKRRRSGVSMRRRC